MPTSPVRHALSASGLRGGRCSPRPLDSPAPLEETRPAAPLAGSGQGPAWSNGGLGQVPCLPGLSPAGLGHNGKVQGKAMHLVLPALHPLRYFMQVWDSTNLIFIFTA